LILVSIRFAFDSIGVGTWYFKVTDVPPTLRPFFDVASATVRPGVGAVVFVIHRHFAHLAAFAASGNVT
jgi:hypothetical protein